MTQPTTREVLEQIIAKISEERREARLNRKASILRKSHNSMYIDGLVAATRIVIEAQDALPKLAAAMQVDMTKLPPADDRCINIQIPVAIAVPKCSFCKQPVAGRFFEFDGRREIFCTAQCGEEWIARLTYSTCCPSDTTCNSQPDQPV